MKIRSLPQVCHELNQISLLRELSRLLLAQQQCFLVGGAIRDMFLGRPCNDFDFITPFDPTFLARDLARHLSGHWFFLDAPRRQSRVVIPAGNGELCCDFSPFRSTDIVADLSMRDFRVNAIAVRLHDQICPADVYDPLCGLEDLKSGQLTICSANVLRSDPLRILKGLRHCKTLHLTLGDTTLKAMRAAAPLLTEVAGERVRKELGLLFNEAMPAIPLRGMLVTGTAEPVFGAWVVAEEPSGLLKRLARFGHNVLGIATAEHADFFFNAMQEEFEEGFPRQALLNLAMVLQDRPMCDVQRVIARMKLARASTKALTGYVDLPAASKLLELQNLACGFRGRYWWVSGLGPDPVGCLLYLASSISGHSRQLGLRALTLAEEYASADPITDLVDGNWLCQCLGIEPGPLVGEALHTLRYEEIAGRVHSVKQAREFLQVQYKKSIDNT